MPVWHVSASLWDPHTGRKLSAPSRLERAAITALTGVGGDTEWWCHNTAARVGHLRVALTPDEYALVPPGTVTADAGDTGPARPRRHPPTR